MAVVAPSDIKEVDVLDAIAEYDKLEQSRFLKKYDFGESLEYRLVYGGKFYESKAIVGVAHGFATGEFWTKKRPNGGVAPGGAVTILRDLGFLVDDGELFELTQLKVDQTHGKPSPYKYVVLLWAIARARGVSPRLAAYGDSRVELASLLAPFAIAKTAPNPATPWIALRSSIWWDLQMGSVSQPVTEGDALMSAAGLSEDRYARISTDDTFAAAAVDVIFQLIGSEPGFKPLLDRLELSALLSATPGTSKAVRVNWSWDELVIAVDMIASNGWQSIQKSDLRVAALSEFLRRQPEAAHSQDSRGPGSVYFKLENIRSAHPDYPLKKTKGGKTTQLVVDAYLDDPEGMHRAAQALWKEGNLSRPDADQLIDEVDGDEPAATDGVSYAKAVEGRVVQRLVRVAERDPKLRKDKIAQSRTERGSIACETCGFDFEVAYPGLGEGFVHVHHVVPLHFTGVIENGVEDLILVCANCHVMIHRQSPWKTPDQLREILAKSTVSSP